ncbi:MAG: VanW family protein [Peptostreptococcaceae bacterium]|nr:VanW family protein [Peptostreptococcaceae bacterium]
MQRKLFCEISPMTYRLSVYKQTIQRKWKDFWSGEKFASSKSTSLLPVLVYSHKSLMKRTLGNVDQRLQENKVINLNLAAPKVSGILIEPGEIFSFWRLVGPCTKSRGYQEGLFISSGKTSKGVGGGMCQFTNLIHWMLLHTSLKIVEHHHHDGIDLFPDHGRQVPFGLGTSIMYNYIDYRFRNTGNQTYQLIVYTTDRYLCGEIRTTKALPIKYHIWTDDEHFIREGENVYRKGRVLRRCIDKRTGKTLNEELLKENHAKVLYDFHFPLDNNSL